MTIVQYHVVEHDGGWTYRVGDTFAETFPTREAAEAAARLAAREQRAPPDAERPVEYEDRAGNWHVEDAGGAPQTDVDSDDA